MADNAASVANRDEAIPVISISNADRARPTSPAARERSKSSSRIDQLRASQAAATARMRSKLESKLHGADATKPESSGSMQDRLMNMCVARLGH
jgi:Skp family chaperone for outer membrane proteins